MKINFWILSSILVFFVPAAFAGQAYFTFRGAQLVSYSLRDAGPRKATLQDLRGEWKKNSQGAVCKSTVNTYGDCSVVVTAPIKLWINDYSFTFEEINIAIKTYKLNDSVTNGEIEKIKTEASPSDWNQALLLKLYDVKNGTVFTDQGACYSYELVIYADIDTKKIIDYNPRAVAAPCP